MFSINKQVIPILSNHFQKYNNIKIDDKSNNITIYKADFIGILQETLTATIIQNILTLSHVDNIMSTLPMFSYFSYLFPHRKAFRRKDTLQSFHITSQLIMDHFILSPFIYLINHFIISFIYFIINIIYVCTQVINITVAGTFDKHSLVDSETKYLIKS
jgi:hypothetical protein